MTTVHARSESLQPAAGLLALLAPGLGHIYLGEVRRGLMIALGVLGLFVGGLLIGGIDVVDRQEDFWWFVGEAGVGPIAFGANWINQNRLKANDPPADRPTINWFDTHPPLRVKSLGHVNETGSLYATIAGMMNVICVLDALWHAPRRRRDRRTVVETPGVESQGAMSTEGSA